MKNTWIGVDLDGTLAYYDGWKGVEHIGEPIPAMVNRVKTWLDQGIEVRILTARVSSTEAENRAATYAIHMWCKEHIGQTLPVTCRKDYLMIELWDDRAVRVEKNTGRRLG